MTNLKTRYSSKNTLIVLVLASLVMLAGLALLTAPVQAQADPTPAAPVASSITFNGVVESIGPRFIVVNGLLVDLENAVVPQPLELNATVTVVGNLQNNVVLAVIVQPYTDDGAVIPVTPTPAPAVVSTPVPGSATQPGRFVIQGPVRAITDTAIRIFGLEIGLTPATLNTAAVRVGDTVRVVGEFTTLGDDFQIVAVNILPINASFRGDSFSSLRDSVTSSRDSVLSSRDSVASSRDSVSSGSTRQSAPPPPPPPPPPRSSDNSDRDSVDSNRSSISAASARSS